VRKSCEAGPSLDDMSISDEVVEHFDNTSISVFIFLERRSIGARWPGQAGRGTCRSDTAATGTGDRNVKCLSYESGVSTCTAAQSSSGENFSFWLSAVKVTGPTWRPGLTVVLFRGVSPFDVKKV
jgi:hypothetical protein